MIVRPLAQSLRDQNWTTITIEFVLLVIGVYLGIQAANWNQARADQRRGQVYAQRLSADLAKDLASRRALVTYYGAVLEAVERTDRLLDEAPADPQDLLVSAYRASEINYQPPTRATWDQIVSTGATHLLPPQLAGNAADYFAFDTARDILDGLALSPYRERVRTLVPLSVQKSLRAGCSDLRDDAQQIIGFMPGCTLDLPPETIAATAAALRADPAMRTTLRQQYSTVFSAQANISGDVISLERALAAVATPPLPTETAR